MKFFRNNKYEWLIKMQTNILDIQSIIRYLYLHQPTLFAIVVTLIYGICVLVELLIIRKLLNLFRDRSPNLVDGLLIILNFSAITFWVAFSAPLFHINQNYILGGSALGVAIIGISASNLGSNFMGGLFIIFTRPFGVGDIITYNGNVGLVTEIGLNYTKILQLNRIEFTICNANLVNALIHNSSVFVKSSSHTTNEVEFDLTENAVNGDKKSDYSIVLNKLSLKFHPSKFTHSLTDSFATKKIVRLVYTFNIRQDMPNIDVSIEGYENRLKNVCKKFIEIFGFEPEFYFVDNYWRITTTFVLTAIDPYVLFNNFSNFLQNILHEAYLIDFGGIK